MDAGGSRVHDNQPVERLGRKVLKRSRQQVSGLQVVRPLPHPNPQNRFRLPESPALYIAQRAKISVLCNGNFPNQLLIVRKIRGQLRCPKPLVNYSESEVARRAWRGLLQLRVDSAELRRQRVVCTHLTLRLGNAVTQSKWRRCSVRRCLNRLL